MDRTQSDAASADVCGICQRPFSDGETVLQLVEDRHPTYDKVLVLHTYHKSCCDNRETVTHGWPHCGCLFHLCLLPQGEDYQNLAWKLFCAFCGAPAYSAEVGLATKAG